MIITGHTRNECGEAGVLGQFMGRWPERGKLGELRQCSCGRWWRCSSAQWQHWDYLTERRVRKLTERVLRKQVASG